MTLGVGGWKVIPTPVAMGILATVPQLPAHLHQIEGQVVVVVWFVTPCMPVNV